MTRMFNFIKQSFIIRRPNVSKGSMLFTVVKTQTRIQTIKVTTVGYNKIANIPANYLSAIPSGKLEKII